MTLYAASPTAEFWQIVGAFLMAAIAFMQFLQRKDVTEIKVGTVKRDAKIDGIVKDTEDNAKVAVASHSLLNSISLTKAVRFAQKCDEVADTRPSPENKRDAEMAWQEVRDHQERQVLFDKKLEKTTIAAEQRKEAAEKPPPPVVAPLSAAPPGAIPAAGAALTMEVKQMDVDQLNTGNKKP